MALGDKSSIGMASDDEKSCLPPTCPEVPFFTSRCPLLQPDWVSLFHLLAHDEIIEICVE
jgi:hypothetical protein